MIDCSFKTKDVIGKQPKKNGDTFYAKFFGAKTQFRVTEYVGPDFFMAEPIFKK